MFRQLTSRRHLHDRRIHIDEGRIAAGVFVYGTSACLAMFGYAVHLSKFAIDSDSTVIAMAARITLVIPFSVVGGLAWPVVETFRWIIK